MIPVAPGTASAKRPLPRWRRRLGWLVLAVGAFLGAWAFWWEPGRLVVEHRSLALPRWNAECDGLRVAVLADLHTGSPQHGLAMLQRISAEVRAQRPDLVLLAGDFVIQDVLGGSFVAPERIGETLRPLATRIPTFAVLGNHDWWLDGPRVARAFEANGIPVLTDRAVAVRVRGCRLWLVGIGDYWETVHDVDASFAQVRDAAPALAFTHNPDLFPWIPARAALTVAGHTHGGQVHFPLLGRPVVPSQYGERYAAGHVVEGGRHLYVSTGLGTSILPVRFRVPPQIAVLELRAAR
jgi:hypothetical protein